MFPKSILPQIKKQGSIEVICGGMFSGKTTELIRRVKGVVTANQQICVFKPKIDTRSNYIVSHNHEKLAAIEISKAQDILNHLKHNTTSINVIAIDEIQFLDNPIIDIINKFADDGIRVIVAGLDMDFKRKPFGPLPFLLSIAEHITKLNAICSNCGGTAIYSFRKNNDIQTQVLIGEKNEYEPRCRLCYK